MKRYRALLFLVILVVCIGCDQTTKRIAESTLEASPILFAGDLVRFELAHNSGGFLSVGSGLSSELRGLIFLILVPLVLAAVCLGALRSGFTSGWSMVGLGCMAGGGLGNWLDRLTNGGAVTDFLQLGLGPLRTGLFNLADVFIIAGVGVLLLAHRGSSDASSPSSGV